eukprot:TRINITY_DN1747_c0_g1_i1.p2 TRINITY_DN1747_c0_g1~~TRINITY_DN1747_c0_g1_i1.p2  ORF type:complete len:138 (-),score=50.04 TRINITY_DN1747_c0_g1_i1:61-474(-)
MKRCQENDAQTAKEVDYEKRAKSVFYGSMTGAVRAGQRIDWIEDAPAECIIEAKKILDHEDLIREFGEQSIAKMTEKELEDIERKRRELQRIKRRAKYRVSGSHGPVEATRDFLRNRFKLLSILSKMKARDRLKKKE